MATIRTCQDCRHWQISRNTEYFSGHEMRRCPDQKKWRLHKDPAPTACFAPVREAKAEPEFALAAVGY